MTAGSAAGTLYYLGPQGSFTHQAAIAAASGPQGAQDMCLQAVPDVSEILRHVDQDGAWGIIAWENNVEGYVVPNLDALIGARGVVGVRRIGVDVSFDAFVRDDAVPGSWDHRTVTAHPHGLAQCRGFITGHHLIARPAASNAAACRDLQPGHIALGPAVCGELYGLTTIARSVQDYRSARTDFLVLAPRRDHRTLIQDMGGHSSEVETVVAFIPVQTGPGVLAGILDVLRDAGLNLTSFISRPIKGQRGIYSFIATVSRAPWDVSFHQALQTLLDRGVWIRTMAVYPWLHRADPPVDASMLPGGGALAAHRHGDAEHVADGAIVDVAEGLLW